MMIKTTYTSWCRHRASVAIAVAMVTPSTSQAAAADAGLVAATVCPSWSGFSTVGSVWEYRIGLFLVDGWERWELTDLDIETGSITVSVTGERATDAYVYSYDREDFLLCDEEGLWSVGWTITWNISDPFGHFSADADSIDEWSDVQPVLPADPMDGDIWTPSSGANLYRSTSDIDRDKSTGIAAYTLVVGAREEDDVLGETRVLLPILRYYREDPESGFQDSYTTWYAEDIGMVRRDDLILTDFTPGTP